MLLMFSLSFVFAMVVEEHSPKDAAGIACCIAVIIALAGVITWLVMRALK